jgi:hypothetical protein
VRNKKAFVVEHLHYQNEAISWVFNLTCPAQDWELESVSSFLELLYSSSAKDHGVEVMCWNGSSKEGFQVKSYYRALLPLTGCYVPGKSI